VPLAPRSRRGGSSVASSFWREPRVDRTDGLSVIDERFEKLALEYEDDDIGDLEDEIQEQRQAAPHTQGVDAHIQDALDDYIKNYRRGNEVVRTHAAASLQRASLWPVCMREAARCSTGGRGVLAGT
jgi:hypothetical protein